jgi:hypothetical protein
LCIESDHSIELFGSLDAAQRFLYEFYWRNFVVSDLKSEFSEHAQTLLNSFRPRY